MIAATVQGKFRANNCAHITAKNGEFVYDDEQMACGNEILLAYREVSEQGEIFCEISKNRYFCTIYHPENDEMGRKRLVLILLDKNTPSDKIAKTLEIMGLDIEKFNELKNAYKTSPKKRTQKPSMLGLFFKKLFS